MQGEIEVRPTFCDLDLEGGDCNFCRASSKLVKFESLGTIERKSCYANARQKNEYYI